MKLKRRLRLYGEADLAALCGLGAAGPPPHWSAAAFLDELGIPCSRPRVLVDGRGVVSGFLVWWVVAGEAHLQNVAVAPGLRRSGHGRWLVNLLLRAASLEGATRVFLEVRPENAPAIALYRQMGFTESGRRRRYYADGADALLMARSLPGRRARAWGSRGRWSPRRPAGGSDRGGA